MSPIATASLAKTTTEAQRSRHHRARRSAVGPRRCPKDQGTRTSANSRTGPLAPFIYDRLGKREIRATLRFSELSPAWQALIRLFQSLNQGHVRNLVVRCGAPVFDPKPTVTVDIRLDSEEGARPEIELPDFVLRDEVRRLMAHFAQLGDGLVERMEIRAGLPRRVVIASGLTESRP